MTSPTFMLVGAGVLAEPALDAARRHGGSPGGRCDRRNRRQTEWRMPSCARPTTNSSTSSTTFSTPPGL